MELIRVCLGNTKRGGQFKSSYIWPWHNYLHGRPQMKLMLLVKPLVLSTITLSIAIFIVLLFPKNPSFREADPMARSFVLWLHGLGDSGPANEPIKTLFTSPEFRNTKWLFPSAPSNPVTCNFQIMAKAVKQ
ncbi:probable carboxylesterase SOBER1-like [Neltuma alba]|uniref:probable carboxylesterase SOBER1-like n=1 Tax=Neltuma alba TaxID=207710 RepID=UPI0010A5693F|nr:probable carboxylesterase SOBER1-like [Prosopis alba]